jgi:hypothetical protein
MNENLHARQGIKCKVFKTQAAPIIHRLNLSRRVCQIQLPQRAANTQVLVARTSTDLVTIKKDNLVSLMTPTLKAKAPPLLKRMYQGNLARLNLSLKNQIKIRKRLRQNRTPTLTKMILTRTTRTKKLKKRDERPKKQNSPPKLFQSKLSKSKSSRLLSLNLCKLQFR